MSDETYPDIQSLNPAERRVLDAVCGRAVADFTGLPDAQRSLRAEFLEALIAGSRSDIPKLCCALRVRGARILGPIRSLPGAGDGPGTTLLFWDCDFDSPVDLSGADLLTLRLVDCRLPGFVATGLTTRADLDLSGSHFAGISGIASDLADVGDCAIHLSHARIGGRLLLSTTPNSRFQSEGSVLLEGARIDGNLDLRGALLRSAELPALDARSATIGGNVNMMAVHGHRCEVYGEVSLVATRITGDLDCSAAALVNPGGRALHCEDLVVESVFLSRGEPDTHFEASGRLNFLTATIGGSFFLSNARLVPGPDYTGWLGRGGRVALNLQQSRISNSLILFNIGAQGRGEGDRPQPVEGWFLLLGAQMNSLIDSIGSGWPAPGYLDLDGATYQRLRHVDGGDLVSRRIEWLRLQFSGRSPDADSFRPQPYEQLTRALRNSGLSREADAIAVEKIRMRLAARVDSPLQRIFPRVLMLLSEHGYSTRRAVLSFLAFVLLGAVMYTVAVRDFAQPFHPFEQPPEPVVYTLPFGFGEVAAPLGCPGLDTLHYALDFALPVIDLGQDSFCRFVPEGEKRWLWLILHSLYGLLGAALSAVVILTLTGLLRRD